MIYRIKHIKDDISPEEYWNNYLSDCHKNKKHWATTLKNVYQAKIVDYQFLEFKTEEEALLFMLRWA